MSHDQAPVLVFTQGDPAGIGPEILLRALAPGAPGAQAAAEHDFAPLVLAEAAALDALRPVLTDVDWSRVDLVDAVPRRAEIVELARRGRLPVVDPGTQASARTAPVTPGRPGPDDAVGALRALDAGVDLVRSGVGDALVTAPLSKSEIAKHLDPDFRGHTDYLAAGAGLTRYGRDYQMAFLSPELRVSLLTTHVSLRRAIGAVTTESVLEALRCLHRHGGVGGEAAGPIAVCGLNPHAGEGGLLGSEDETHVRPAVEAARAEGIDAHGPLPADTVFQRARRGDFRWVLALYHDQGLVAVKTAAFGEATNWTLGLPYLRTSVDHGTAYDIAGSGRADIGSLRAVIASTLDLLGQDG